LRKFHYVQIFSVVPKGGNKTNVKLFLKYTLVFGNKLLHISIWWLR